MHREDLHPILYPATNPAARPSLIEIREPSRGGNAGYVALRPVHLERMVEMLDAGGARGERTRHAWAAELAGLS